MVKVDNTSNKRSNCDDEGVNATDTKRSKVTNGGTTNEEKKFNMEVEEWRDAAEKAWEHYRNYLDSAAEADEDDNGGGSDTDELTELIDVLSPFVDTESEKAQSYNSICSLLPILISMSYLHLGSHAISEGFYHVGEDNEDEETQSAEGYLSSSLRYWSENPATLSMLAKYHRMNLLRSPANICDMYAKASDCARAVREAANKVLDSDDESVEENLKEWVELLLLDGAVGVEYIGDDDESEENNNGGDECEEEESTEKDAAKQNESKGSENADDISKDDDVCFSPSGVEATSSFMTALIGSTLGWHNKALRHLKKFGFTHRIHPNVWETACGRHSYERGQSSNEKNEAKLLFQPKRFCPKMDENGNSSGGVLPPSLYQRLCDTFAPSSPYWKESSYDNRGYYSYFLDLNEEVKSSPSNIIEDVIANHLLPLVEEGLPADSNNNKIVGAEWWVHTRPIQANLGHQLHFDTDEAILAQEGIVSHPVSSSVLYLTGDENLANNCRDGSCSKKHPAGSTIVIDQTPDSKEVGTTAYISHAKDNSYMMFPGNLLHGVLPCPGNQNQTEGNKGSCDPGHDPLDRQPHRLTFMVGFWTRRVPDKMKERPLYGPCGMLPPATDEHTWVRNIAEGYKKNDDFKAESRTATTSVALPQVAPAWEYIGSNDESRKDGSKPNPNREGLENVSELCPPKSLDHRFFVHNAPQCFSDSLFDKDECF